MEKLEVSEIKAEKRKRKIRELEEENLKLRTQMNFLL
jgi:hypothetical protein